MVLTWTNQREETIAEGEAVVIPPPDNPQLLSKKEV
jgi:quercetin dioxygenase-like cupin family protein